MVFGSLPAGADEPKITSTDPSGCFRTFSSYELISTRGASRTNAAVSKSYTVTAQNCFAGTLGGTHRRHARLKNLLSYMSYWSHVSYLSYVFRSGK